MNERDSCYDSFPAESGTMKMKPELLEHLHSSDFGALAQEAEGRFPLSELQEAARTEEASWELVEWLEHRLELYRAAGKRPRGITINPILTSEPKGARTDGPPMSDLKNYEQGSAGTDQTNEPPS